MRCSSSHFYPLCKFILSVFVHRLKSLSRSLSLCILNLCIFICIWANGVFNIFLLLPSSYNVYNIHISICMCMMVIVIENFYICNICTYTSWNTQCHFYPILSLSLSHSIPLFFYSFPSLSLSPFSSSVLFSHRNVDFCTTKKNCNQKVCY